MRADMAFYLVHQWWVLPDIAEVLQMGEGGRPGGHVPPAARLAGTTVGHGDIHDRSIAQG